MSERNYNYIFSKLVNAEDDVVGLLAYAIYKQQKIEYIEDFTKKHDGRGPTDEELAPFNELTSQNKQIENYKNIAETRFGDFLDRLMRRHLEEFKEAQKTAHKEALLEAFASVSNVSIHSRPVRRLTPQPTDRGRADCPSLKGGVTEKDFIGSAVLSTTLFPLKGEVSNHKGIFDESHREVVQQLTPSKLMKFGEMALSGIVGNFAFLVAIAGILFLGILYRADYQTAFFNDVLSWLGVG